MALCLFYVYILIKVISIINAKPENSAWVHMPYMYLQKLGPIDLVLRFEFDETVIFEKLDMLYPFLREVVSCYSKANTTEPTGSIYKTNVV